MRVERIASGGQAVARRGGAIAEGPANPLVLKRLPFDSVPQYFGIGQHHPPQANRIDPSLAHRGLRHVRQEILQVAIPGAHDDEFGKPFLSTRAAFICRATSMQRIGGRPVAVRRRIDRRALNVRM